MVGDGTDQDSVSAKYDWSEIDPNTAVVKSVSALENREESDLSVVLYEYIDPESLNKLVTNGCDVIITFNFDKDRIQIDKDCLNITFSVK